MTQPGYAASPASVEAEGTGGFTPDPNMTAWDLDVLRVMNGDDVPGMVGGAAMMMAAAWLKGRGYAEGHYNISRKGREYLAAIATALSEGQ